MTRCRYLRRNEAQCTAEVVDEQGEALLCSKHVARVIQMLGARGYTVLLPASSKVAAS